MSCEGYCRRQSAGAGTDPTLTTHRTISVGIQESPSDADKHSNAKIVRRMADTITITEEAESRRQYRQIVDPEVLLALAGYAALVIVSLSHAAQLLEPDDYAYQASIRALREGHILLSTAQYSALELQISSSGGLGVAQWHHLASGYWISEKNPGYPFFAVIFSILHVSRATPLFFGAVACIALFFGARAWLGRYAGTYAVLLYCSSGAALAFAWREMMPTFTDASLIAAAFGTLVYVGCTPSLSERKKTLLGLAAFVALESSAFIRYTDALELGVVIIATISLKRVASWSWRSVAIWMGSVMVFVCAVLAFDWWAYGSPTSTGYSDGEISFSISALWPNLTGMPKYLLASMPLAVLAATAFFWIIIRLSMTTSNAPREVAAARLRDATIGAILAVGWLGMWVLYLTYPWTVTQMSGLQVDAVHLVRFYLPALGCLALLSTYVLVKLGRRFAFAIAAALFIAGALSFHSLTQSQPQFQIPPTAMASVTHVGPLDQTVANRTTSTKVS